MSAPAARSRGWRSGTLRSLRHRNFRLFFGGQLVSLSGTWMQQVAQSWLVYRMTGSPLLLGLAAFATRGPILMFGLLGGVAADRLPRHRTVVVTQTLAMLQAFALAALVLGGHVEVWHVFALAAVLGIINAFDMPARQAFPFEMVGPEDVSNAIALNSSAVNAARIVGPSVAGIVVAVWGEGTCFLLNGLSFLAVLAGLLAMRGLPRPGRARTLALEGGRRGAPVRVAHEARAGASRDARRLERARHAVHDAHADLRGRHPPRRSSRSRPRVRSGSRCLSRGCSASG